MSAPYGVLVYGPYVRDSYTIDASDLEDAIAKGLAYPGPGWVEIYHQDRSDGDDGLQWRNGLTPEERERVEEEGL